MSVLCCRIPNFLIALACRQQPAWAERPLALLGPDERVWAVSPAAQRYGVQPQMRPQQAQIYCPEVLLRSLDAGASQAEQAAFLAAAAQWELPVEPQEWGVAYVDLHSVGATSTAVRPLAVELGQRVRAAFGDAMQPALGWDSGKFTARAAAVQAAPGRVRLVDKADETRFLNPLPITLLPLPRPHLQQLHWLGVRTLGQFAALPPAAVWQRFGTAGKLAHLWAQGRDDRAVQPGVATMPDVTPVTIDPPSGLLRPVLDALMATLQPALARWAKQLAGVRHLRVTLDFVTGGERTLDITFVEPASQPGRVQAALVQQLCALAWPGQVQAARWQVLETGELIAYQPTLFADPPARLAALDSVADGLVGRYGPSFYRSQLVEPRHPLAERRSQFLALVADPR